MSRKIEIESLTEDQINKIENDLQITQEPSKYTFNTSPNLICLYDCDGKYVYVPFYYGKDWKRPERKNFTGKKVLFSGSLREEQRKVKTEVIDKLNSVGCIVLSAACGFGKTSTSIYISTKIGLKTLILCHRIVLLNQWKNSLKKFCPDSKVQIIEGKTEKIEDADFYIMNAANVQKHNRDIYKDIGLVIVDEAHIIMAERLSHCMRYLCPRYIIALSATPYRTDGLNILLDMYFGESRIERKLFRKHTVYRYDTGFKPEVSLNRMGKIDWSSVLQSQCLNKERNETIIKIIKYFPERVFLVLCKRVEQANYIVERLKHENQDVTSLIGSSQTFNYNSRILVGTVQKTGVGFDHDRLNSLILASDVEQYFIQYLGRVFRSEKVEPIIFDLVDNFPILFKHFKTRTNIYLEHGGVVKNFKKEFPDF